MARSRAIDEERILKLTPKAKRYNIADGATPNLFVRVGPQQKTFVLVARFGGAKNTTRRKIGVFPAMSLKQARKIATAWNALIERGLDPRKEDERTEEQIVLARRRRFASAMEDYLADLPWRERNRHVLADIQAIRRDILNPAKNNWLGKPMAEVTAADISRLVKAILHRGAPAVALTTWRHFKAFFSWAMEPERQIAYDLRVHPIWQVKPKWLGLRKRKRKHCLSRQELRAYWQVASETPYPYGPFFKGLQLTGVRKSELSGMRWSEIDWEDELWIVPETRAKSESDHLVPLSDAMLRLLHEIRRSQPESHGDFVFSTTNGQIAINGFSKETAAFRQKMAAALSKIQPGTVMQPWILHDNRRVVRTKMPSLGVSEVVAETVLGHGRQGIESVYNQYQYLPETREALDRLGNRFEREHDDERSVGSDKSRRAE